MTDQEILDIAHRTATVYRHRSDPDSPSYGFVNHTVIDFGRKVERAVRAELAKPAQHDAPEVAALKAERDALLVALERARPHIGVGYSAVQRHTITSIVDAAIAKAGGGAS